MDVEQPVKEPSPWLRTLQREVRMRDIDPWQPPLRLSILTLPMAERSFSVFAGVQRKQLEAQKS